jgi:hypothetical protein
VRVCDRPPAHPPSARAVSQAPAVHNKHVAATAATERRASSWADAVPTAGVAVGAASATVAAGGVTSTPSAMTASTPLPGWSDATSANSSARAGVDAAR